MGRVGAHGWALGDWEQPLQGAVPDEPQACGVREVQQQWWQRGARGEAEVGEHRR